MINQIIEALKVTANELMKVNPEFGGYAWRKINYLGKTPTMKMVLTAAEDIQLMAEKAVSETIK